MPLVSRDVAIFDCDGVLVDSNQLKIDAIAEGLVAVGLDSSVIDGAVSSFTNNFGSTRKEHAKLWQKVCLESFTPAVISDVFCRYSSILASTYINAPVIEENADYLNSFPGAVFVVSASEPSMLRSLINRKFPKISDQSIFGGDVSKKHNLAKLKNSLRTSKSVYFGDSTQDACSSLSADVPFFGVSKYSANPDLLKEICIQNSQEFGETCLDFKGGI
jgi:phosphoglycolate phosphatase-like HAD superfamily hydrolase